MTKLNSLQKTILFLKNAVIFLTSIRNDTRYSQILIPDVTRVTPNGQTIKWANGVLK